MNGAKQKWEKKSVLRELPLNRMEFFLMEQNSYWLSEFSEFGESDKSDKFYRIHLRKTHLVLWMIVACPLRRFANMN